MPVQPACARLRYGVILLLSCLITACNPAGLWPTDSDFNAASLAAPQSVEGWWWGSSPHVSLTMQITLGARGQLLGSGTIRDGRDSTTTSFAATASYARPNFALAVNEMTWKGHRVRGSFRSQYMSAAGMSDELVFEGIDGDPFVERILILLVEY